MGALLALAKRLGGALAADAVRAVFDALAEWWRAWQARSDAIRIGRDETRIDQLEKVAEHEKRMAAENLTPPDRGGVDRRLRDHTF